MPQVDDQASFGWLVGIIASVSLAASVGVAAVRKYSGHGQQGSESTSGSQMAHVRAAVPVMQMPEAASGWDIKAITPDRKLLQRVEGMSRKTWKFEDYAKDRVQVALTSEGRPVHADCQLWLGPDWTPMKLKAYSEDGNLRPIQTLIGTRNKQAMIEVKNVGEYEFPLSAASNYAQGAMAQVPQDVIANTDTVRVDGGALRSFPVDASP